MKTKRLMTLVIASAFLLSASIAMATVTTANQICNSQAIILAQDDSAPTDAKESEIIIDFDCGC
ncbi:MAG: hypothetical protein DRQ49_06010 [Gammaproteobacteria bacterium]|nr:MAG: hypothetical protein DRQ49_06010 [Gammaproteobacteria bacterium]RKZ43155.1 MAG: hypothetical protein DRQ41_06000 [Gammaproteobacteria bacterium]RKZ75881.1 MAG: hypothetical protein DRQ57_05845 [Gammaproteobacteria bacterium]